MDKESATKKEKMIMSKKVAKTRKLGVRLVNVGGRVRKEAQGAQTPKP
ncbi:MAG: hypothetical protein VB051_00190 [Candidatus Pelethousia sp.]|nr:hypothetical protein [Candidatus Pelethousia sp.]